MGKFKDSILTIIAVITLFTAIFGGYTYIDTRYALAGPTYDRIKKLEKRVSLNELRALLKVALEDYYFYKSQARKYPDDEEIKAKLKEVKEEVDDLKKLIKEAEKEKVTE